MIVLLIVRVTDHRMSETMMVTETPLDLRFSASPLRFWLFSGSILKLVTAISQQALILKA